MYNTESGVTAIDEIELKSTFVARNWSISKQEQVASKQLHGDSRPAMFEICNIIWTNVIYVCIPFGEYIHASSYHNTSSYLAICGYHSYAVDPLRITFSNIKISVWSKGNRLGLNQGCACCPII